MHREFVALLALAASAFAQKKPFDVDALLSLARISDPQISPDGRMVTFTVQSIDVAANKRPKQIWATALAGGSPRQLTREGENNQRARWSPDGKSIAFISDRGGSAQVWIMNADGADARQVTNLATEADGVLYSPDGKNLLFTSTVFPGCNDEACNKQKAEEEKSSQVKARIYEGLLYRHWTAWQSKRRSHLMVVPAGGGAVKDLTSAETRDVPPFSLGGQDDYDISPDGKEVCYAINADAVPAISTNTDLYVVSIEGGPSKKITINPGADNSPLYSPDGKYIGYRAQNRPGYESDRWRLHVLERATGKVTNLTENIDRWINGFIWSPDSSKLFFTSEDRGRQPIEYLPVTGGGIRTAVSGDSHLDDMQLTRNGEYIVYTMQTGSQPVEIYRGAAAGGPPVALTHLNDGELGLHQLTPLEDFWVEGAEKAPVQSFVVKPPNFDARRKYPVLLLIHGGPQGAWGQDWSYRWNAQVFAAAGYVVVMPNPRGSTGYGQKFIDEINRDWGGRAFEDLMAAADHMATVPYADIAHMAAAGASYGGYMADWILGHSQRFKAIVSHAGVFDLRSMFGATEELWFPLWEFKGPPWDNAETYERWSPSYFVKQFHTPTLVVHGELDFRVPYTQGLQLFTALQLQKVPSKLLIYPDEGHWILKPQNSRLWYKTVIDWIDTWTKK
jgi:dipeptidyl aminopeptidase/acylaminoacyl peptidase